MRGPFLTMKTFFLRKITHFNAEALGAGMWGVGGAGITEYLRLISASRGNCVLNRRRRTTDGGRDSHWQKVASLT